LTDYDANLAVELSSLLLLRLENLLKTRVYLSKQRHWVWDFVKDNSVTIASIIVLQQHVVNAELVKLAQFNRNTCVLESPNNNFMIHNSSSIAEGCYLFYDRVNCEWVRTGKVTGRSIGKRVQEHEKAAQLLHKHNRDSNFCVSYPLNTKGKRGKFEWLDVYIGLGCFPTTNNNHTSLLTSNLFCYKAVPDAMKQNNNKHEVMHNCIAYLFESCYDLLLSTSSNVSVNPGFESFTGQF